MTIVRNDTAQLRPLTVLTMDLEGETFALEAHHVREILDLVPVTDVPRAKPFVGGLINVRGRVVPLVDLRVKFGMAPRPTTIDSRIVIIDVDLAGDRTIVGIRADKVYEVTELAASTQEDAPRMGLRWRSEFVSCIGKRAHDFIVVLDLGRIFADGLAAKESAGDG